MKPTATLLPVLAALAVFPVAGLSSACSSDSAPPLASVDASLVDATPTGAQPDGQTPTPTDAQVADAQGADARVPEDAGSDSGPAAPVFIAKLDQTQGQLTEGLWEVSPSAVEGVGTSGTPVVSYAPLGQITAVSPDGGTATFGAPGSGAAQSSYTLGITTDATGNVYVGVAAAAAPPNNPAPGVYKLPAAGGAGSVFSLGSAVTPAMGFPNGLDFVGADLFVADSEGVVYKVDATGKAAVWSQDPLLAPDKTACGGAVPLPIGANGIVHDAKSVYVTNTNFGRLIAIPIAADGSAGAPSLIKEDCAALVGADGLVIDPKDGSFIVALNVQNRIVRVTPAGVVSVLASGAPLANPASVLIDTWNGRRRLVITSSAFFTAADAGSPGLLALPIP